MKRKTLICIASLLLVYLGAVAYLGFCANTYRKLIHSECDPRSLGEGSITCLWRVGSEDDVKAVPSWWQIVRGARPTRIHFANADPKDSDSYARLAKALRFFGTLEKISISGPGDGVMTFVSQVGRQKHLTGFFSFRAPITDQINESLAKFPKLQDVAIESGLFTGSDFPKLFNLRILDVSASAISAEGLRDMAQCPNLKFIKIGDHPGPSPELIRVAAELKASHPNLDIRL
jgi:hypothetical protein